MVTGFCGLLGLGSLLGWVLGFSFDVCWVVLFFAGWFGFIGFARWVFWVGGSRGLGSSFEWSGFALLIASWVVIGSSCAGFIVGSVGVGFWFFAWVALFFWVGFWVWVVLWASGFCVLGWWFVGAWTVFGFSIIVVY